MKEPSPCSTFQVKATLYVNFIAVRKYNSLLFFYVLSCVQNLCCNDSEYHSLNWKDVSVTNVEIVEKKAVSLQFFFSLLQVNIVYSFFYYQKCLLVSISIYKGFAYLLCDSGEEE